MRQNFILLIVCTFFFINQSVLAQIQCDNDSTGLIAIPDLGTGYYLGTYQGGLYPGGVNDMPAAHLQAGRKIAKSIKPLDAYGNVDWENGKVAMTAFGASTTGEPFNHFIDTIHLLDYVNPCFQAVTGTQGGKALEIMQFPDLYPWYWDSVFARLADKGMTPEQVQIAWFKSGSKLDTIVEMPLFPNALKSRFTACLGIIAEKFPNMKLIYMSGFVYGGYGDPAKEFYEVISEPGGYMNNFAIKWLIEDQINGVDSLKFTNPGRKSPWIAWGPYEWADGEKTNIYNGLEWNCELDFTIDGGGYHLTNRGRSKEAALLLEYFKHNPTSRIWFMDNPKWSSCDPFGRLADGKDLNTPDDNTFKEQDIQIYPSPNDGNFYMRFVKPHEGYVKYKVINNLGEEVFSNELTSFVANEGYSVNLENATSGIYHLQVNIDGKLLSKQFVVR